MAVIESINPMSFDSGPGIRVEVILSDNQDEGIDLTPNELVDRIRKFRPYFGPDNGGVTFKGNNIFLHCDYINKTCKICHKAGITTCIQTTGNEYNDQEEIFDNVDLFILSVNGLPLYNYNNLSVDELMSTNNFMNKLNERKIPVWLKQEFIKDINDNDEYIGSLKKYIGMYDNIENVDVFGNIDIENLELLRNRIYGE